MEQLTDLKAILHSKRANIYYLEKCRVMQKDCTWQTVITADGLNAVKKLLRKTASKNTAVACHWQRSRGRSELVWIVGNRCKFNAQGIVPVHSTLKNIINTEWENDWKYLPLIKAISALAALFHDFGKASLCFQNKLDPKIKQLQADPLRHEWVSCLLLQAFVSGEDDPNWLSRLAAGDINEQFLKEKALANCLQPFVGLPNAANLVCWLVLTHHLLPLPIKGSNDDNCLRAMPDSPNFGELFGLINADFGYANKQTQVRLESCLTFPKGLPSQSGQWLKLAQKWAAKLLESLPLVEQSFADGSFRLILQHARLCLMLGDHHYSSLDRDPNWKNVLPLYANTERETGDFKQFLDEHLVGVAKQALLTAHLLPAFEEEPPQIYDVKKLKQKSTVEQFRWQDKAVEKIKAWKTAEDLADNRYGFFAVNLASTGCGKTLANAKIMQALANDSCGLRFVLALGLRTLTLQTGDEYRSRLGLDESELAVMIGSRAVLELHRQHQQDLKHLQGDCELSGSESEELLLDDNEISYECAIPEEGLATVLGKDKARNLKFLYAPVLTCTIDHLMAATETRRGGRFILPSLRLMSSDLVIDEIDDFSGSDLIAIGRLVHLAGMLGRKVMISSATIPPDLAEGYFNAYQAGWRLFAQTRDVKIHIGCAWIDEFSCQIDTGSAVDVENRRLAYRQAHQGFIYKRCARLQKQAAKRIAEIVSCGPPGPGKQGVEQDFFAAIQLEIVRLHFLHSQLDEVSGKHVSFGVVRMANISPCVTLTRFLARTAWPESVDIRIMAYHSQQVLLLRSAQERHLDAVLNRKNPQAVFANPEIRGHLQQAAADNVIFILVATPVEEVGRDHDFDWAVVEPSSYRSIIQLAGRVLRHREARQPLAANMGLLQYNLEALKKTGLAFYRPGYESEHLRLDSHDLNTLIPIEQLTRIDAVPRIRRNAKLLPKENLADLEHESIHCLLTDYVNKGPHTLQGWLTECWWLTALPQRLSPFRESEQRKILYLLADDTWHEKTNAGDYVETLCNIKTVKLEAVALARWWLLRDYTQLIEQQAERMGLSFAQAARRYGELSARIDEKAILNGDEFLYTSQLGFWKQAGGS